MVDEFVPRILNILQEYGCPKMDLISFQVEANLVYVFITYNKHIDRKIIE